MRTLIEGLKSYKRTTHTIKAELQIKQSRFDLAAGSLCCVFEKHTLLSQCFSSPKCINVYYTECTKIVAGGNAANLDTGALTSV